MSAQTGEFSAFSAQFSENCKARGPRSRAAAGLVAATMLSFMTLGCLPGDENNSQHRSGAPVSNLAEKADRLDAGGASREEDLRVETTATVIPTSAPEAVSNLPAPAQPVSAGEALQHFFAALAALDRGERQDPVTILHLGDEHIAADRITAELRARFQARFGDAGRGLMAPGVFRIAGAQIKREGDWRVASSSAGDSGPFGLAGVRLTGRNGAVLQLAMPDKPFDWAEITFASGPNSGKAYVAVDDKGDVVSTRTATETWQRIRINAAGSTLTVRAEGTAPVHLLSWRVVRENAGVRYINLGVPGATVRTPQAWNDAFVKADLKHLAPDLIIMGYGTNGAFKDDLNTQAYANAANALIGELRAAVPQASFLVVGPPDLARLPAYASSGRTEACRPLTGEERANYGELMRAKSPRLARWHPPLKLRAARWALRLVASRKGAFFWDWSRAMGGPCSIHAWAHANPPLAAGDHRHFTAEGARKSASALFRDIMEAYDQYRARAVRAEN
ncbi:GDSL-type esterase/lipase family protein [Dichotomicrobium thermohalophilum]|uniref:GDSL-like lipase/acylhydrolase family protein n=1 Tax=Dichotomicrobium thermohalophilum TaxID=933063 RepID=A0A397QAE9_9HYPH|nr:GDSL-type esterase/lipase family protein [Dichotomicrobium thermohalophilum]RIA55201.1 GDSL-like lipase/acylhydrolase family protein [Dichotomicrobium thermohalophilum]